MAAQIIIRPRMPTLIVYGPVTNAITGVAQTDLDITGSVRQHVTAETLIADTEFTMEYQDDGPHEGKYTAEIPEAAGVVHGTEYYVRMEAYVADVRRLHIRRNAFARLYEGD